MKKSNLFIGILLFIVGLLMLVNPGWWMRAVIAILGIEAIANGIYSLVYVRKLVPDTSFQYTIICRGMLSIVIGLIAFFFPFLIEGILRALFCLFAIYLIAGALLEMFAVGKIR
ncbi:MAG: DUF308 domain-containing protein, partial [Treponemataceae bacterium]|nr:DUF308 domain-containing protein [Treponemataceae bacterium]